MLRQRERTLSPQPPPAAHPTAKAARGWETLPNCQLRPAHPNDGDSFLVAHDTRQTTFRLYFVDCPEKASTGLSAQRLTDQARYFDLPSPQAAATVGAAAAAFTLPLLERPFTVRTKWERVYDSQRCYAQVLVTMADGTQRDLAELLVEHGLARIFTKGTHLPGPATEAESKAHLHQLEAAARATQRGAWQR